MLNFRRNGGGLQFTNPGPNTILSGQVVRIEDTVGVAAADIAIDNTGTVVVKDVIDVPKISIAVPQGKRVFWDDDGDPVNGVAGTGGATPTATGNYIMGFAVEAAAAADETVAVELTGPVDVMTP